jgi:hypothetical protein
MWRMEARTMIIRKVRSVMTTDMVTVTEETPFVDVDRPVDRAGQRARRDRRSCWAVGTQEPDSYGRAPDPNGSQCGRGRQEVVSQLTYALDDDRLERRRQRMWLP